MGAKGSSSIILSDSMLEEIRFLEEQTIRQKLVTSHLRYAEAMDDIEAYEKLLQDETIGTPPIVLEGSNT
jgi:hypothetical protein